MSTFRHGMMALTAGGLAAGLLASTEIGFRSADAATAPAANAAALKPASEFANIKNNNERAIALFQEAGKVIESPRCMNCHTAGERPTQTDRMRPHQPLVVRGDGGMGALGGLVCTTCHHEANFDPAGIPGNPKWFAGTSRHGVAGQDAWADLRADQGQGPKRQ